MTDPDVISNQSPGAQHAHAIGAPVQQVRIDLGPSTIAIVASMLVIIAACGVVLGLNLSRQAQLDHDFQAAELASRLKERRLMDMEAYLMLRGWKAPADENWGPTGNMQRMLP